MDVENEKLMALYGSVPLALSPLVAQSKDDKRSKKLMEERVRPVNDTGNSLNEEYDPQKKSTLYL